MINEQTCDILRKMKLNAMANELLHQLNDPNAYNSLGFEEGKEKHCEFDGVETLADENGRYCYVPVTHKVTLGEIVDLLQEFKQQPQTLLMPKMPNGSFAKKLYSLEFRNSGSIKFL